MKRSPSCAIATTALSLLLTVSASAADNPFVSNWALPLPDGHASWLCITQQKDYHAALLLRDGGSVVPLDSAILYDGAFAFTREPGLACLVNVSAAPVAVPDGWELLLASGPLADGAVPAAATAVFRR